MEQIAEKEYNKSNKLALDLQRAYKDALKQIEIDIADLYIRMAQDGEISPLTMYKYDRYTKLMSGFNKQLEALGYKEQQIIQLGLLEAYRSTYEAIGGTLNIELGMLSTQQIEKAVAQNWNGRNFSTSIWANKQKLLKKLNKMVIDNIALGKSKDETIKDLMKAMGVGFSDADRLVRTEMMFIINQAQKEAYVNAGYEEYEVLAALDKRTSNVCEEQDGKIYRFIEAQVGINYPPFHPRCRTTVVPVIGG